MPIHSCNLLWDIKKLPENAELPNIRFYDLLHITASLLLNQSVPVIEISRRLGHSWPSTTLDVYGHLIPGSHSKVVDMLDELVTQIAVQIDQTAI